MAENKGNGQVGRALRRGVALGLALIGVWGVGMTVDFSALGGAAAAWGAETGGAAALLERQLGALPGTKGETFSGWGRLLLGQSAVIAFTNAAATAILALILIFIAFIAALCEEIGYKKGDPFYTALMIGLFWIANAFNAASPLGHSLPLILMSTASAAGQEVIL